MTLELIKGGALEPDMATQAMSCRSLTELRDKINKAWAKKKEENDQLNKLQQQLQEAQQQIQQLTGQNEQLSQKVESMNEQKLELEKERIKADTEIRWFIAHTDREYKSNKAQTDERKVDVEFAQIYDGNPYNDKVNFSK